MRVPELNRQAGASGAPQERAAGGSSLCPANSNGAIRRLWSAGGLGRAVQQPDLVDEWQGRVAVRLHCEAEPTPIGTLLRAPATLCTASAFSIQWPGRRKDVKITQLEVYVLRAPETGRPHWVSHFIVPRANELLVRMHTDEGVEGIGLATTYTSVAPVVECFRSGIGS
jgi:hypothetical protein